MLTNHKYGRAQCGSYGELLVAADLIYNGWEVFPQGGSHNQCDILASFKNGEPLRISVKSSNSALSCKWARNPTWHFGIRCNASKSADLIAFVFIRGEDSTIIKYCVPEDRHVVSYSSNLNGKSWIERTSKSISSIPCSNLMDYIKYSVSAELFYEKQHVHFNSNDVVLYHATDELAKKIKLIIPKEKENGKWKIPVYSGYHSTSAYIEDEEAIQTYQIQPKDLERGYILH